MEHHAALAPGATFEGRYEVVAPLGEGGFGAVYKARQLSTGHFVALKIMRTLEHGGAAQAASRVARFLREARVCAQLRHPNIVPLVDAGQTPDGMLYIVFSFVPGDTLAALLESEGALAPREARHLMLQVLDALACAHGEGIVHRDLKPSNILVIPTGARRNALVLDFGIGAVLDDDRSARVTGSHDTLGTPGYGAPEQWRSGPPAPRADLFSWGLVLLECLTGAPVYTGTAAEIFYRLLAPDPVPIPEPLAGHPLGALVARAVRKDAAARDVTARELLDALDACDLRGLSHAALARGAGTLVVAPLATPLASPGMRASRVPLGDGERRSLTALCCRVHVPASGDDELRPALMRCADAAERHRGAVAAVLGDDLLIYFSDAAAEDGARQAARAAHAIVAAIASHGSAGARSTAGGSAESIASHGSAGARSTAGGSAESIASHGSAGARSTAGGSAESIASHGSAGARSTPGGSAESINAENRRRAPERRLEVAIGIHSGPVAGGPLGELDGAGLAAGATPRLAARLAALAPPGSAIVSAASHALLCAAYDLAPEGARSLDGDASSIETFRLGDERRAAAEASLAGPTAPISGRDAELALLIERWQRARGGAGQSSLVTGEAGIGKSRLARELRDRMAHEAHHFLDLRCSPDTQNSALVPVIDLLARALGLDREPDAVRKLARLEGELARYRQAPAETVPLLAPLFALPLGEHRPLEVSAQRRKAMTLEAVVVLLLAMGDERPVLLLAEDLHWADPTTLELLTRLVREVPSGPLCLVMTARPEFAPAFSSAGMLMLPLARLGRPQVEQMVAALMRDKALPPAVLDHVADRADGVPLFVEELLRMMVETGILAERAERYELTRPLSTAEIPRTLSALLTARLERLARAKDTAQLASVLGREFSLELLSAASPLAPEAVAEDLERLIHAGLVLRKRRTKDAIGVFKHALVRDAAYASLSPGARQSAHARIAAALEERFPDVVRGRPDVLAHHHAAAEHKPQAVSYGQKAAEQGLQRSTYAEAIAHASNAIAWAAALPRAERIEAELLGNGALIQALMASRGWADPQVKAAADRSAALLDEVAPDSAHRVPTLWFLFTYHHVASHRRTARAVAEQLVAIAERSGDPGFSAAAAMLHGLAMFIDGDHAAARPVFERAVTLYDPALHRDHGARFGLDSLVLARAFLAHLDWFAGDAAGAFALVSGAIAWAREVGHVPSIALGLLYGCTIHQRAGDRSAVAAMAGEILALSARFGLPAYEGYAATLHAWATGDDQRVRAIVGGLSDLGCKLALSYYGSLVADRHAERGELDAAIACIDHCLSLCRDNDEHFYEPELYRRRALYEAQRDPAAEAVRTSLERAAQLARHQDMPRVEALAALDLVRRFGLEQPRARLAELLALHPGLRELERARADDDEHREGGTRWAWTS